MRRSFGGGGGGSRGGLRSVQRVLRAGGGAMPEPFSAFANSATINGGTANSIKPKQFNSHPTAAPLTLSNNYNNSNGNGSSSAFSTLISLPKSGASGSAATTWGSCSDGYDDDAEWECVDAINREDDQRPLLLYDDFVFGTVPSTDEVNCAISALQKVFEPSSHAHAATQKLTGENEDNIAEVFDQTSSASESGADWIEPSLNICGSLMVQTCGSSDRVYDAFRLLQTEPSVQRMVLALSSDKSVWDAVLNNEVVKELRGSISQGEEQGGEYSTEKASDDEDNPVKDILSWFIVNTKVKFMQLIDKITKLATGGFQPANEENNKGDGVGLFQEKLKTSLFLSIVILLIVVVTRAKSA